MCCCGCHSGCSNNGSGCSSGCGSSAGSACGCSSWDCGAVTLPNCPSQDAGFAGYPVTLTIPAFIRRSYASAEAEPSCGCWF